MSAWITIQNHQCTNKFLCSLIKHGEWESHLYSLVQCLDKFFVNPAHNYSFLFSGVEIARKTIHID